MRRYEEQLLEIIIIKVSQVQLSQRDVSQERGQRIHKHVVQWLCVSRREHTTVRGEREANHENCIGL